MQSPIPEIWEQIKIAFVKYVPVWAVLAIFIKISVEVKKKTATWMGSILSLIIGVLVGSMFNQLIKAHTSENIYPIAIGAVAILGEKLAEYLMFRFKIEILFKAIKEEIILWIKSKLK
jgi:hypothetical protein